MKTALKVLLVIGGLLLAFYLLLRYVFFPVVAVDHLYPYIPDDSEVVFVIETEQLTNRAMREMLNSDSPLRKTKEDSISSGLGYVLAEGIWNGLDIPAAAIIYVSTGQSGSATAILPMSDGEAFRSFMQNDTAGHHHQMLSEDIYTGSKDAIHIYDDHIRIGIGGTMPDFVEAKKGSAWLQLMQNRDVEAIASMITLGQGGQAGVEAKLLSLDGELRIDLSMDESWPIRSIGSSDGALLDAAIAWDKQTLTKHPIWSICQVLGLDERLILETLKGDARLCVQDLHPVVEEFVSYTYDENFEKVRVIEYQERLESSFSLELNLAEPTDSLLFKMNWIEAAGDEVLFKRYPFQEVLFEEQDDKIILRSRDGISACTFDSNPSALFRINVPAVEQAWNGYGSNESVTISTGIKEILCEPLSSNNGMELRVLFKDQDREGIFGLLEALTPDQD